MNLLRVWGGGVYENDAFYDYCDENGILVWHDFMFANAMYPGVKEFVDNVQAEGIQQVVRLRNHPCIALWCGNSEIDESWRNSKWSGQYTFSTKDSSEIYLNYRMLFYEKLRNAVRKFDPKVPYIPSSPNTGWGNPFGIQAFPEMSSIRKFTTPADIMFDSPVIKSHQKSPDGDKLMDESLLQYYKKTINFDSYVYVSQLLQAEEIKNTIEGNRRAMPYSMGSLFWQLNDCWPGVTSSSTDYYGKKKALGYWIKDIYATTIVSPVIEDKKLRVYVVTDNLLSQKADLLIELVDFTGKSLMKKSVSLEIPANTSMIAFDTAVNAIIKNWKINEIVLLTTLKNGSRVISENNLYFDSPKNLNLQVPAIQKQITQIPEGYKVELSTDKLAKNIYLKMPFKGELPENYFDLIPGRPKTLIYITKTKFPDISNMVKITSLIDTY